MSVCEDSRKLKNLNINDEKLIIVKDDVLFTQSIQVNESELIKQVLQVDGGANVDISLNVNTLNCFDLLSSYNGIFSEGNIFVSNNQDSNNFVFINNEGKVVCNNIEMVKGISIGNEAGKMNTNKNAISIGNLAGNQTQNENIIIINASGNELNGDNNGLFIDPIRENKNSQILYYNKETKEITYSIIDNNFGSTGPQGAQGSIGSQGAHGSQGAQGSIGSQGTHGSQGPQGSIGSQGTHGSQGPRGAQGTYGPQGAKGIIGSQGSQGTIGYQGSTLPIIGQGNGSILVTDPTNLDNVYYSNDLKITNNSIEILNNIVPSINNTFSLGTSTNRWKEIYVGPGTLNLGSLAGQNATIGADDSGIAYTEFGFATPFINIGPSILTPSAVGGWKVQAAGTAGTISYDLVAQANDPNTGYPYGPIYSLIHGTTGAQGSSGSIGVQGSTGPQGNTGYTGSQGDIGPTGPKGDNTGYSGATGSQGSTGPTGPKGDNTGYSGATGSQGSTGPQGFTGAQGNIGTTGAQGSVGNQGFIGVTGSTGAQGSIGNQGFTGVTGFTGAQGSIGNQGFTGAQGSVGNQGFTGVTGSTGAQGSIGVTGAQGSVGNQGFTGAQGSVGNQGFTGVTGAQGNTGPQGINSFINYLVSPGMTGNFSIPNLTSDSNYYNIYQIDTNYNIVNILLPEISTIDNGKARSFYVADIGGNANINNINIETTGSNTIAGSTGFIININYSSVNILSNKDTKWLVL